MVLPRTRAKLTVEWDIDPVYGWNSEPLDFPKQLQKELNDTMGHYNPKVTFISTDPPIPATKETPDEEYIPLTRIDNHGDGTFSYYEVPEDEV